jgi:hypothetical protein
LFSTHSFCQNVRKTYLGFGTGINYPAGLLGASVEVQVAGGLSLYGALGLGSWGGKVGTGLRFYPDYPQKFAFSLSYSYATGIDDVELELEQNYVSGSGGSGTTPVQFRLLPASTINITALKHWLVGKQKKNRFGLEAGYAIPTSNDRYEAEALLTAEGRSFMKVLQPGGFVLGTTFSIGL